MNSIGTVLKEARAKKAISLEEVHTKIKIHPRVLQLLEDGKFDRLPSPIFVKSFLRSYAEFLELSPEELIQTYEKEDRKEPEQVLFLRTPEERKTLQDPYRPIFRAALTGLLIIAVLVSGIFLWKKVHPILIKTKERKTALAPESSLKPAAAASKTQNPWLRSVELGNFPKINKKTRLELKVRAIDNVWLRVTCDEKVLFQSILQKGTVESWKANESIELWTGNASSTDLILNHTSLGSPGKGVAKKMLISREGVKLIQKI